jgi:hypothetical protein
VAVIVTEYEPTARAVDPTFKAVPFNAKSAAFVPDRARTPDHVDGATVMLQTFAPAAKGPASVIVLDEPHVTEVEAGLVMMTSKVTDAASAAPMKPSANTPARRAFLIMSFSFTEW